MEKRFVWLDADPVRLLYIVASFGHDDALAILLAVHSPTIHLLGVSTVHGNTTSEWTALNAARCLYAFAAQPHIRIYPGATKPLIVSSRHDPQIHGVDGLAGVQGLPDPADPNVQALFAVHEDGSRIGAIEGMAKSIKETWQGGSGHKVTLVSTGSMTNVALFVSVYPDLLDAIDELVFMGGAVGTGNRSPVAEFNILVDPHAAHIAINAPIKKVMIPLNVTHTVIATESVRDRILGGAEVPASSLRNTLSTLVGFFADAYKTTFGFDDGPPLHDPLTIAYIARPDLFKTTRHRVDIELAGNHTIGETVLDIWNYRACDDSWGPNGKNCIVAEQVDVSAFFDLLHECIARCDPVSPINIP
ncbi:hypothetical protein M378DRAFT_103735 [Amanita muscaria Koide BX008]|uniref:Inosine/uridine-preferring nucleoside hydrolase domain-containing protein n=1 Tax=Amanita muscaria (strain Koide BX008) TaxID=946122 RepID=A0A0C2XBM7_AMAMK|nr:hypothetical protein M378DRAFT_103735 [Amanita muscaria Koide BX008]